MTTPHADRRIIRTSRQKPNMSSKDLKNELQLAISPQTIRRRLNEEGLFGRIMRKKPLISKANQQKRLDFAIDHLQ